MVKDRRLALALRLIASAFGIAGLSMMFYVGFHNLSKMLVYFTIQTNIFITLQFIILSVMTAVQIKKFGNKGEVAHYNVNLQLAIVFFITITFIVFATMLSNISFSMATSKKALIMNISNVFVHYVVPILALADWVLFMPHGRLNYKAPLKWLIYPVIYFIFIAIRAQFGGPMNKINGKVSYYPYPFIDLDVLGWYSILVVLGFTVGFYLLGILIIWLDKQFKKIEDKKGKVNI